MDRDEILKRARAKADAKNKPLPAPYIHRPKKHYEKTVLLLQDLHVPYHDEDALGLAIEHGMSKDPDIVIVSEIPDFYKVSPWKKDPARMSLMEELYASRDCVNWLSKTFEGKEKIYIIGNHDERLKNYINKGAPELSELEELHLPNILNLTRYEWEIIDNKARMMRRLPPYKMGHLTFLHGHEVKTGWGAINLAKIYYERCRTNVCLGHHHRCQEWIVRTISGKHEGCWLVGGLCQLSPEFLPHNDWIHGFAVIRFDADGDFKVKNHKIINGKVL